MMIQRGMLRRNHETSVRIAITALLVVVASVSSAQQIYSDGRPAATMRMDAEDHGIILRYGDGPDKCDMLDARDVWVFEDGGTYYMHYDAAGPKGWLCSLAESKDLISWEKKGPWIKQKSVVPFRTKPGTYYSITASPGHVIKNGDEYLQFFSCTTKKLGNPSVQRTLSIARTKDLDGPWRVDAQPMVPIEEQIENSSLYYEKSIETWFLFTNHIGIDDGEYTDAVWIYWSKDLNKWDPANKAVVLDSQNCTWSKKCIGLPSVVQVGKRLALFCDAPGGNSTSHMRRHIGLAWLDLPLELPKRN